MQTQLPIFPETTRLFNHISGVYRHEEFVYYLHNGLPIFCHQVNDRLAYRYITANMVVTGMCTTTEISKTLGVTTRSLQLHAKALREKGSSWFFHRIETRGKCYKYNESLFAEAQLMLDACKTQYEIARKLGVSESSIRYHIKNGKLKKKEQT